MKWFSKGSIGFWLVLMVSAFALLACDVGSLLPGGNAPSGQPAAKDAQSRISDSLNRLLLTDQKVLDSYHLEVSGTESAWNKDTQKVESQPFTFKADVQGDNVHFVKTVKAAKETTTEGYILNLNSKDDTKGYSVQSGKVKEDLFMPLTWAMLPLEYGMPLIFGAMGPTARGDEAVNGRAAEKFDLDMSKAPTGAEGLIKTMGFGMQSSKGTAWIDKQNGALLKMNMDYASDVQDSGKVMGQGSGHIELVVSQVGQVTVKLPDASMVAAVVTPMAGTRGPTTPTRTATLGAAKGAATLTPTAAPGAKTGRVGQRVVANGIALTVSKLQTLDTFGGKKADSGNIWVVATVTVENTTKDRFTVEEEQFEYVDNSGSVIDGMLNGPSAPGTTGKDVMGMHQLIAGGKVTGKTLPIQMEKTLLPGLQLMFTIDDENTILINSGIGAGPAVGG